MTSARHGLAIAVLLFLTVAAADAADLPVTTKVLENGCTIAVVENHQAPVVALRIYVKNTGSLYEGKHLGSGISHYCEQVIHGGTTETRSEAGAARMQQSIGGATNAYTSRDVTCYYGETHVDSFDLMLELFADWVRSCTFDDREVEREREVIRREEIKSLDEPERVADQLLMKTMFRVHPVRHPVIGHIDDFLRLTAKDLRAFYRERYVPNNLIVVVGGDVDPDRVLDRLELAFSFWERRSEVDEIGHLPEEPRQIGRRLAEVEKDVQEAVVRIGYHTIPLSHPDLHALDLLAAVLGNGRTSRLHRRIVEKDNLTDGIAVASHTPHYGAGVLQIILRCPYENVPAVEKAVTAEIDRLLREPPTDEELVRAKALIQRDFAMQQRKAADQAEAVAYDLMGTGNPNFSARYVERIRTVTAAQVQEMARKYLDRDNETIAVVKPRGEPSVFAPQKREARPGVASTTRKVVLDNGFTVILQRSTASPTIGIQSFFRAGVLWELEGNSGISNLMARLMLQGTKTRPANRISEEMEDAGVRMSAISGNNTFGLSMSLPSGGLGVGLRLYADVLRNPSFPEGAVEHERRVSRMLIRRQADDWQSEAMRNFREAMFLKHPYRRDRFGSQESMDQIDRDAIVAFHAEYCTPSNGVLAIFGDLDLDAAERLVRAAFGDWPAGAGVASDVPDEPALTANRIETFPTSKSQVVICLGFPGATFDSEDRWVLQVIDAGLSGLGLPSGRLHEALRGERNLVYYIHALNWVGFGAGTFYVICPCLPENHAEVLGIIRRELARLPESGFTDEEFRNAKRMCITMGQIYRQTNEERASAAALDELYGFGWDASAKDAARIAKITNEDIKRVAKKHFAHSVLALTAPERWLKLNCPVLK